MKILAICGSYHKNGTINALIDKAILGAKSITPEIKVEKIHLVDKKIEYCKGCMICRNDDPNKEIATCVINDDMQEIYKKLNEADGYIFGTPIFMGTMTAIIKTFCERFCWVLSKPGKWPIKGCPVPRTKAKKAAITIMSTAIVPNFLRKLCDDATKFFRESLPCMLNAKIVGSVYAGSVGFNNPTSEKYFDKTVDLGKKLGKKMLKIQNKK